MCTGFFVPGCPGVTGSERTGSDAGGSGRGPEKDGVRAMRTFLVTRGSRSLMKISARIKDNPARKQQQRECCRTSPDQMWRLKGPESAGTVPSVHDLTLTAHD
jgi:hypothetical protein